MRINATHCCSLNGRSLRGELRSEAKVTERVERGKRKSRPKKIIAMLGIAHKYMLGKKENWSAVRAQKQV